MNASVAARFYKMRMAREIIVLGVLQHEITTSLQDSLLENQIGESRQQLQIVGRIGVDEIILHMARLDELKHIPTDEVKVAYTQLLAAGDDEVLLGVRHLHRRYLARTTRDKLQADATCTRKQVQHVHTLEIHTIGEEIEQTLLGEVRSRTGCDIFRGHQSTPPKCS